MKKIILATALGLLAATSAFAQLDKAASNAGEAVDQKIEQKKAENDAAKSTNPVSKAVNNTKAEYHKAQSKRHSTKAKKAAKKVVTD